MLEQEAIGPERQCRHRSPAPRSPARPICTRSPRRSARPALLTTMRETRLMMGMPITVEMVGAVRRHLLEPSFAYFAASTRASALPGRQRDHAPSTMARSPRSNSAPRCRRCLRSPTATTLRPAAISTSGARRHARPVRHRQGLGRSATPPRCSRAGGHRDFFVEAGGDIQCAGQQRERRADGGSASATLQRRRDRQGAC